MTESSKSRSRHNAATLADIGREAGVSAMAASAVLNGARTTARISEEIAATLLGSEPNLHVLEVFNGVLQGAAAAGQNTTVFTLGGWDDAAQRITRFCDGRIDGGGRKCEIFVG